MILGYRDQCIVNAEEIVREGRAREGGERRHRARNKVTGEVAVGF